MAQDTAQRDRGVRAVPRADGVTRRAEVGSRTGRAAWRTRSSSARTGLAACGFDAITFNVLQEASQVSRQAPSSGCYRDDRDTVARAGSSDAPVMEGNRWAGWRDVEATCGRVDGDGEPPSPASWARIPLLRRDSRDLGSRTLPRAHAAACSAGITRRLRRPEALAPHRRRAARWRHPDRSRRKIQGDGLPKGGRDRVEGILERCRWPRTLRRRHAFGCAARR